MLGRMLNWTHVGNCWLQDAVHPLKTPGVEVMMGKKIKKIKSLSGLAVILGTWLRMLDGTSTYGLAGADWPCFA